jgi:hypothetical protein
MRLSEDAKKKIGTAFAYFAVAVIVLICFAIGQIAEGNYPKNWP